MSTESEFSIGFEESEGKEGIVSDKTGGDEAGIPMGEREGSRRLRKHK